MPSFDAIPQLTPINSMADFYAAQRSSNENIAAQQQNQLASQTLGSRTQISANLAQSTGLANQLATQKNPLEIIQLRQQLGIDPSPTLDRLRDTFNGGVSQPSSQGVTPDGTSGAPGGGASAAPLKPFVASNLPAGIDDATDQIVRTVYGEAGGESPEGQRAVASVIRNRVQQSGMSPTGVIFAPGQFEPWNNPKTRAKLEALDPASRDYQSILANIRPTLDGTTADPTGGATHFYSPTAQAALGRQPPSWGQGPTQVIGGHQFYKLGYAPGSGAPGAPPTQAGQQAVAPTQGDVNQPPGPNHPAQPVVQVLAAHVMAAPPDQRPALYAQLRPAAIAAGATAPEQYPGDDVIGHLAGGGWGHPSATAAAPGPVQVAGPGAPTVPDPAQPPPAQAAPPPQQGVDDVMARLRAAQPPIPNQNAMFSVGAPDGVVPAAPLNGMAGMAPQAAPQPQLMPAASSQPPAPQPALAQPAQTGMNAPQVQAAQDLLRRATQIEMLAAQTPNDPRVKATAAAMAADLRGRAAVLMQADSVTVGTNGVQTHALTGKQDSAAVPTHNPARVTKVEGAGGTLLTQPGSPDRVIPYGGRPEQTDAYKADIPRVEALTTAAQSSQASMPRLNEMAELIPQLATGPTAELRAKGAALLEAAGASPQTIKAWTGMASGAQAQELIKYSISTAGAAAKADVGANNGIQSTQLYQSANPGILLLPDANKHVTNMLRVSAQQIQDYAQAALQHFGTNETAFLSGGNYAPLTAFNRTWLARSNPQIGAAAIGVLNGDPFAKWSAKVSPEEATAAIAMAARIEPNVMVPTRGGIPQRATEILAHPAIPATPN